MRARRRGVIAPAALGVVLGCLLPGVTGCESEPKSQQRTQEEWREEGARLFGGQTAQGDAPAPDASPRASSQAAGASNASRSGGASPARSGPSGASSPRPDQGAGWSIVLEVFSGADANADASARLAQVRSAVGRSDVWIKRMKSGSAIMLGSYADAGSSDAQADLRWVRQREVGGRRPWGGAFLSPPASVVDPGRVPELNLTTAKQRYGRNAVYTLQIGVYESKRRDEAKRAAEEAALTLRRDGELAFYYHGPTRSMVTIGVFGPQDYDERLGIRNPALAALRDRYPLNLLNGQYPLVVKRPGQPDTQQRSILVRIP